jgi:outer membrane protein assembly factor BamA
MTAILVFAPLFITDTLSAEEKYEPPATEEKIYRFRSDILEAERKVKIEYPGEGKAGGLEEALLYFEQKKVMEYLRAGYHNFHPKFGGLTTGSGFALGPLYRNRFFSDTVVFTGSASWSFKGYQQYELGLGTRLYGSPLLRAEIYSRYRNFNDEDFFGIGPNSSLEAEASYRIEETMVRAGVHLEPLSGLITSLHSGYRKTRTGRGSETEISSQPGIFVSEEVPAFLETIDHRVTGFEVNFDLRDSPGNPRSGIAFFFNQNFHEELDRDNYSFRRTELEFQGYLPFYHKHRVFALRFKGMSSGAENGQNVPFYDLPMIGGHNSLRGFREHRFQDQRAFIANLEYRFEAFIGLDIALFGDLGQVGSEWDEFRLSDLKSSYGGGLRFNTVRSVFLRIDVGHGTEGTRFFFKFGNVFR